MYIAVEGAGDSDSHRRCNQDIAKTSYPSAPAGRARNLRLFALFAATGFGSMIFQRIPF
jgi:hypothetical protein